MKTIRLLLSENVDNLGIVGDVVRVRPGYARNFLLPRGLAMEPSEGNIQRLAARRAEVEKEMALLRKQLEALFARIEGYELTLMRSANEQGVLYGGVSQHDLGEALREEGLPVEDRMIRVGDQIKRLDSYDIPIVVANDLKTTIKVWVVSDKPTEELDTEEGAEGEPQGDEGEAAEQRAAEA